MIDSAGAVRQQTVVDLDAEQAYDLFAAHMTEWWPSDHHIGAAPIEHIVIEPHEGGRWYTKHADGSETSTGVVRAWDPPRRLVLTWQITSDWQYDTALITMIEVRFTPQDGGTLVEVTHSDFDNYGPDADKMREVFDSPDAWAATLAAYSARAGGA